MITVPEEHSRKTKRVSTPTKTASTKKKTKGKTKSPLMPTATIYTDGSFRWPNCGAWAALITIDNTVTTMSGYQFDTTIGQMELTPIAMALKSLPTPHEVYLFSDSQYAVNCIKKGWIKLWRKNGWKNHEGKPVKNSHILEDIYQQLLIHKVKAEWVRGHNGHRENEIVDRLAQDLTKKMKAGTIVP